MRAHLAIIAASALAVAAAGADTLVIPGKDAPPNSAEGVPRPVRGMSMDAVLARFGEPAKRVPAVGEPPIARWVYERFTVYFEGGVTLHAVVNTRQVADR